MRRPGMNIEAHAQLRTYLVAHGHLGPDDCPEFETLTGGVSNRTVWVRRENRADWVIKQALAKLRVQVDWFSAPERIGREAAGLRWLGRIIPGHVPEFVFTDDSHHLLCMSAVPAPHQNWKAMLLNGQTDLDHARQFGRILAEIHNAADDIPELKTAFADRAFFEELRLEPYYQYTASQVPAAARFLNELIADTRRRKLALVHGDYSPKNVLVYRDRVIILDFEVIHFGDPAFDLGFSLTHLLSKAHFLPHKRADFFEMSLEYWREYARNRPETAENRQENAAIRHTLACLLARVAGRSPLEYFDDGHRRRQARAVLQIIERKPATVLELIDAFKAQLEKNDERD